MVEQQLPHLPEIGEVWTERWQAPAGVRIERIGTPMCALADMRWTARSYPITAGRACVLAAATGTGEQKRVRGVTPTTNARLLGLDKHPPLQQRFAFRPDGCPMALRCRSAMPAPSMVTYSWMLENGREDSRAARWISTRANGTLPPAMHALRRPVTADGARRSMAWVCVCSVLVRSRCCTPCFAVRRDGEFCKGSVGFRLGPDSGPREHGVGDCGNDAARNIRLVMLLLVTSAQEAWSQVGSGGPRTSPILLKRCVMCHSGAAASLSLRLDTFDGVVKGKAGGVRWVKAGDRFGGG